MDQIIAPSLIPVKAADLAPFASPLPPARDRAMLEADYEAATDLEGSWDMTDSEADEWASDYEDQTRVESGSWCW